jgi:hypothetical protein
MKHNRDGSRSLLSVLACCTRQLGLQGLACSAACSTELRDACRTNARLDAVCLLHKELETLLESASAHHTPHGTGLHAVSLLLKTLKHTDTPAAAIAAADAADTLVTIPRVPLQHALKLVEAGMRISYSQLLSAANSMVAGVEVWALAQQQLGIETDIPPVASNVCSGLRRVSNVLCWMQLRRSADPGVTLPCL